MRKTALEECKNLLLDEVKRRRTTEQSEGLSNLDSDMEMPSTEQMARIVACGRTAPTTREPSARIAKSKLRREGKIPPT